MRACRRIGAIALLLLIAPDFPVYASAEPEHIRIQFSAPRRCPDASAFMRSLRQRTGRFERAGGAEQTRIFVVTITRADSFVSGRLEIRGPGTEVSLRNVTGNNCDEVAAALALMTALAIDPDALPPSTPSPAATVRAEAAKRAPLASKPSPPVPDVSNPAPLAPTPSTSSAGERGHSPPSIPPTTPDSTPISAPWKWSAGAHGGVSQRMSPTTGLGGLLFVEAAAPGVDVLGPVLRAGLFLNRSDATLASGAGAEFQWAAVMVEGCPIRLVAGESGVAFYPCLAFHLGVLRGQGRHLDQTENTTDLWSDLGPVARIRVAVSARLFLEAQGMLVLPLRRLTFDVQDKGPAQAPTTVFAVPLFGMLAGIGLSYEFR